MFIPNPSTSKKRTLGKFLNKKKDIRNFMEAIVLFHELGQ